MAKAITYNNAGVVEAIKRNSGSTKFYPASFQGIIQALDDWDGGGGSGGGGGGGTSVLPEGGALPGSGTEGDLVVIPNGDGDYFMYVYANGSWERLHITTEEVETAGSAPFALVTDDGVTLKNQKDINAYLDERIKTLSEKGYDDTQIKADLAQEIADREAGDATLQDQIDALEAYDDAELVGRIDDLEEAVEALPVTVSDAKPVGEDGDLWFDSDKTLQLYVWYGSDWIVASPPVSTEDIENLASNAEALAQEAKQMAQVLDFQLNQQGELFRWDQERQDKAILLLEGEIEQLVPSFERGAWNWDDNDGYVDQGEYVMRGEMTQDEYDYLCEPVNQIYADCLEAAGNDQTARGECSRQYTEAIGEIPKPGEEVNTNKWELTTEVEFSNYDARNEIHTFADVKVGQMIDMVCEDGSYMVGEITAITPGQWYENVRLEYNVISAKGRATGLTKLKIFTIDSSIDSSELDNFLRKTGDTMTGRLNTRDAIWIRPKNEDGDITGNAGQGNMLVVNQESGNQGSIVRIQQNGSDCFKIEVNQSVNLFGNRVKNLAYPTAGDDGKQDAANREYVDDAVGAIQGGSGGLFEPSLWELDLSMDRDETTKGKFYADDDDFYMSTSNANNVAWVPSAAGGRTTNAWVTIYSTAGKLMQTYEVNKIYFKEKYGKKYITEFDWAWHYSSSPLVNGEQYKIVVPGFLT